AAQRAQVGQEIGQLLVSQRTGKSRHPAAPLALARQDAVADDVSEVARCRNSERGAERQLERPALLCAAEIVAVGAGAVVDGVALLRQRGTRPLERGVAGALALIGVPRIERDD